LLLGQRGRFLKMPNRWLWKIFEPTLWQQRFILILKHQRLKLFSFALYADSKTIGDILRGFKAISKGRDREKG